MYVVCVDTRMWEQGHEVGVYARAYSCPLYRIMSWVMCFLRILKEVDALCLRIRSSAAIIAILTLSLLRDFRITHRFRTV